MRSLGKLTLWLILGVLFGTAVGVMTRRMGQADVSGATLTGMMVAPVFVMVLLLIDYVDELVFWAIGGGIVGALALGLISSLGGRTIGGGSLLAGFTGQNLFTGGTVGAVITTWLGAGGAVFKRGVTGVIGILVSVVAGGFMGAASWWLGNLIGGFLGLDLVTVRVLGQAYSWQWGESFAGIPVAILVGALVTNYLFPQEETLYKEVGGRTFKGGRVR
jgi:MFS family permease